MKLFTISLLVSLFSLIGCSTYKRAPSSEAAQNVEKEQDRYMYGGAASSKESSP